MSEEDPCGPENASKPMSETGSDSRPWRSSWFRPGQSGNPHGRPKRERSLGPLVKKALDKTVPANVDGRRRRISKLEAAVTQLANRAAKGDLRTTQFLLNLLETEESRPKPQEPKRIGKSDSLVVAEIIRRFSRPPAPAALPSAAQPPDEGPPKPEAQKGDAG